MAKGTRGGQKRINIVQSTAPQPAQPVQPAQQPKLNLGNDANYPQMSDAQAQLIRQTYDANYSKSAKDAIKLYISPIQTATGYSFSQNMNYKLENGLKLDATESFMYKYLQSVPHPLEMNATLHRYGHEDVFKSLGVNDYEKYSEAQLKNMLVGVEWTAKAPYSMSYDAKKSPFAPGQPQGGGREVEWVVKTSKNTKVFFGAKNQAEIVTSVGNKFKITDLKYTGDKATPKNSSKPKKRVIIYVDARGE